MAAYFVFEWALDDEDPCMPWHIGEPIPEPKKRFDMPAPQVIEVQADGDELDHIRYCFRNLPNPTGVRVVRWFGDMAKFIYHNLPPNRLSED